MKAEAKSRAIKAYERMIAFQEKKLIRLLKRDKAWDLFEWELNPQLEYVCAYANGNGFSIKFSKRNGRTGIYTLRKGTFSDRYRYSSWYEVLEKVGEFINESEEE